MFRLFKKYLLQDVYMIVYSHSRDLHKEKGKVDIAYSADGSFWI